MFETAFKFVVCHIDAKQYHLCETGQQLKSARKKIAPTVTFFGLVFIDPTQSAKVHKTSTFYI